MAVTVDEYNLFCRALQATSHVVQWGGAHVWKVGGKVFAIGGWQKDDAELRVTFKCSDMSYEMLAETRGCRPAPYLASRGMKWIQRTSAVQLDDDALRDYLRASHHLVAQGLSKKARQQLGLDQTSAIAPITLNDKAAPSRTRATTRKGTRP